MVIPPELVDHIFNAEMDEAFEEDLKNLQVKLAFVDAGVGSWVGNGGFSAVTQPLFRGGNGRFLGTGGAERTGKWRGRSGRSAQKPYAQILFRSKSIPTVPRIN